VVFGRAAAERAAALLKPGATHAPLSNVVLEPAIARFDRLRHAAGTLGAAPLRLAMQRVMQEDCAVFRTADVLAEGIGKLAGVAESQDDLRLTDHSLQWNAELIEALELDNLLAQAAVVLHSAAYRTESRGSHAREDFPKRDDVHWLKHTLASRDGEDVRLASRPVHLYTLSNEVEVFPPKERVY
jgi:succinate dehydrogenase/fumarate reductase flavoprotein subunit